MGLPARTRPVVLPSNALALQRLAGNGAVVRGIGSPGPVAVQRWSLSDIGSGLADLAGSAWNAYKRTVAEAERKSKSATGKQADEYLNTTPLIRRHVKMQVEARELTVAGSIRFEDDTTFTEAYITYRMRDNVPDADVDEIARVDELIERANLVRGFTDGDVIHIHKDRADAGTVIHEAMHLYSPNAFAKGMGKEPNEGVTEYFTRAVCGANGILRWGVYDEEHAAVVKLLGKLPGKEGVLADAFFFGDMDRLRPAFDPPDGDLGETERKAMGRQRFKTWRKLMKARDFDAAGALLA